MNKMSSLQLFILMFFTEISFVYLSFQAPLLTEARQDAIIIFFVVVILYCLLLFLFEKLAKHAVFNRFFSAIYSIYWFVYLSAFVGYIAFILATWVLPNTPTLVVICLILAICYYAAISRAETIINIGVFLIPLLILFLIFLSLVIPKLEVANFFPLGQQPPQKWLKGIALSIYGFSGIELYLVYRRFVKEQVKIKSIMLYIVILAIIHYIAIIFTLLFTTPEGLARIPEPILYILKAQHVMFAKRLDIFFVFIWLSWTIVTIMYYLLAFKIVTNLEKQKNWKWKLLLYVVSIGGTALFLANDYTIGFLKSYLIYVIIAISWILPIIILLINKARGKSCDMDPS